MKIFVTLRHMATVAAAAIGVLAVGGAAADSAAPRTMTFTNLQEVQRPNVTAFRKLWADRIQHGTQERLADGQKGPLRAYALGTTFVDTAPPVLVSIFFNMYECDMPGNGAGSDLFARCPMRIVTGPVGATKVKEVADVCHLWVPPTDEADGPPPSKNFSTVAIDSQRKLHLRVVQYGKPVPACDLDISVD
jgi:hypothetical protein